jgi:hypothetical protein
MLEKDVRLFAVLKSEVGQNDPATFGTCHDDIFRVSSKLEPFGRIVLLVSAIPYPCDKTKRIESIQRVGRSQKQARAILIPTGNVEESDH